MPVNRIVALVVSPTDRGVREPQQLAVPCPSRILTSGLVPHRIASVCHLHAHPGHILLPFSYLPLKASKSDMYGPSVIYT